MWPFRKKVSGCPEGSVHAYEFKGKLYRSYAEKAEAIRQYKYDQLRKDLRSVFIRRVGIRQEITYQRYGEYSTEVEYINLLSEDRRYKLDEIVEVFAKDWEEIRPLIDSIRRNIDESVK